MSLPTWTKEQVLDQLDTGYHWAGPAILYGFPARSLGVYAPNGENRGFEALSDAQKASARLAFTTWADLIAKPITEVNQSAQINVANTSTGIEYAHAYFPNESSVWFNSGSSGLQNPTVGSYGFSTFLHEFGHALGLNHMGNYNGTGNWQPSCYQDSTIDSVMSYFGPDHDDGEGLVAWGNWTINGITYSPQTPMLNDVMAIQRIYGVNSTTRTGDTIYGFHTNITGGLAAIYDFTQNLHPILTLYDAKGIDLLDLSGWSSNSIIDLNPGALSDCNGMTHNLAIATNCTIENLTTGAGNDTLLGNAAANVLTGGAGNDLLQGAGGNDTLDGGIGTDTAVYTSLVNQYAVSFDGNALHVSRTNTADAGEDTLTNIEALRFGALTKSISHVKVIGSEALVYGTYADYQIAYRNHNFTVIDTISTGKGIDIYDNTKRLHFDDLTAAADLGVGLSPGEVYRLYLTVLGRNPQTDPVGCGFWIDKLDRHILSTEQMVGNFLNSDEFVNRFGSGTSSNDNFINLMYQNLLGRDGHPDSGFNFWLGALNSHSATREQVVVGFMESPENVANAAKLIGDYVTYKDWV